MMRAAFVGVFAIVLGACSGTSPGRGDPGSTATGTGNGNGNGSGPALCSQALSNECSCTTMDTGTGLTGGSCNDTSVPNGVCCADLQWPGTGLTCQCTSYSCKQTNADGSCSCSLSSTGGPTTTCEKAQPDWVCCNEGYQCECGPPTSISCSGTGYTPVSSCTKATAQCDSSSKKIVSVCQ